MTRDKREGFALLAAFLIGIPIAYLLGSYLWGLVIDARIERYMDAHPCLCR